MAEVTEANTATEEVTGLTEEPQVVVDAVQENASVTEFEARLADYETRLQAEAARATQAEQARQRAELEAKRQEAIYRGFQKETTPKLQEYAKLKAEQTGNRELTARLSKIEKLIEMQAQQFMSPEDRERFEISIQREQLEVERAQLAAERQTTETPVVPEPEPFIDLEQRKRENFNRYFPNSQIELTNPRIDWALDVETYNEWETRFVNSVRALEAENQTRSFETEREAIMREAEERTRVVREEAERATKQAQDELAQAKQEAFEEARVEKEDQLRKLGADMNPGSGPEASNLNRSLNELYPIDERWLTSGDPRELKRYNDMMTQRQRAIRESRTLARR